MPQARLVWKMLHLSNFVWRGVRITATNSPLSSVMLRMVHSIRGMITMLNMHIFGVPAVANAVLCLKNTHRRIIIVLRAPMMVWDFQMSNDRNDEFHNARIHSSGGRGHAFPAFFIVFVGRGLPSSPRKEPPQHLCMQATPPVWDWRYAEWQRAPPPEWWCRGRPSAYQ